MSVHSARIGYAGFDEYRVSAFNLDRCGDAYYEAAIVFRLQAQHGTRYEPLPFEDLTL